MVGVTGLEPATSPPPAVRATNCAKPRYYHSTANRIVPTGTAGPACGHVPRPRNFTIESKLSSEDFLANCRRQFSLPTAPNPDILIIQPLKGKEQPDRFSHKSVGAMRKTVGLSHSNHAKPRYFNDQRTRRLIYPRVSARWDDLIA